MNIFFRGMIQVKINLKLCPGHCFSTGIVFHFVFSNSKIIYMKTIYRLAVSICFLICSASAKSQLQKGNVLLGADIANMDLSLNTGSNFSALLNPKFARFLQDNFALGGYINFRLTTAKGAGTSVGYGIGPLARYYFGDGSRDLANHGRFFVEANAGFEGTNPAVGNSTNGLG